MLNYLRVAWFKLKQNSPALNKDNPNERERERAFSTVSTTEREWTGSLIRVSLLHTADKRRKKPMPSMDHEIKSTHRVMTWESHTASASATVLCSQGLSSHILNLILPYTPYI